MKLVDFALQPWS